MKPTIFLLISLLMSLPAVHAAEVSLSLEQALAHAESNDLSLAKASLEVESGDAQVREAVSAALPNISLSSTMMRHMILPSMYFGEWIQVGLPSDITTDISLQQPIWLAGKLGMALKAARIYRQIARDALTSNRARIKSDVIKEYFGLVLMRDVVEVTEEAYAQANRHAETVKRMYDVGMASEFDLLRAQVEVKTLEPEIANTKKNAELARIALCNRLGLDLGDDIFLTDELSSEVVTIDMADFETVYETARQHRSEFKVFDLRGRLDEISLKAEQRNIYWPNFVFGLNYRRQYQDKSFNSVRDVYWPDSFTWTLNMSVPLFDGFATSARVQKAKIGLRRTQLELSQLEQGLSLEVSLVLSELKRAEDQINSLTAVLELARKALDIAETRYEQGISTELEVLDSQLALHRAQLGHLQGLYDLRVANAEYARIVHNDHDFGREN
ncbi:TolC family protein [bacterium]|nr:TolC family protein [bacterium]